MSGQTMASLVAPTTTQALSPSTVISVDGRYGVILDAKPEAVDVWLDLGVRTLAAPQLSVVTDPNQRQIVLRRVLAELNVGRDNAARALDNASQDYERALDDIRTYVLTAHEDGDVRLDALQRFFKEFGLEPYEPDVVICYIVSGSYRVTTAKLTKIHAGAQAGLAPDLDHVDGLVESSTTSTVVVDDAEAISDLATGARCTVRWRMVGKYEVTNRDPEVARAEGRSAIAVVCEVPDLVPGSFTSTVESVDGNYYT